MGRGVSAGGGQSSLGYLFGSGEAPKPAANNAGEAAVPSAGNVDAPKPAAEAAPSPPADVKKQSPAGVPANTTNNYFRADGQNCGNFLTVMFAFVVVVVGFLRFACFMCNVLGFEVLICVKLCALYDILAEIFSFCRFCLFGVGL